MPGRTLAAACAADGLPCSIRAVANHYPIQTGLVVLPPIFCANPPSFHGCAGFSCWNGWEFADLYERGSRMAYKLALTRLVALL